MIKKREKVNSEQEIFPTSEEDQLERQMLFPEVEEMEELFGEMNNTLDNISYLCKEEHSTKLFIGFSLGNISSQLSETINKFWELKEQIKQKR